VNTSEHRGRSGPLRGDHLPSPHAPMPTALAGTMGKGEKRVRVVQETDRRSKRQRKVVHRDFFVH